jgi:hypothetical protein
MIFDPINEVPTTIKVVFVVNDEESELDFEIVDPKQNIIYSAVNRPHVYYQFNVTIAGEYIFVIKNKKVFNF